MNGIKKIAFGFLFAVVIALAGVGFVNSSKVSNKAEPASSTLNAPTSSYSTTGTNSWQGHLAPAGSILGAGTSGNPYLIDSEEKLALAAYEVNRNNAGYISACFVLKKDLDLSSYYWTPIGTASYPFKGKFDGGNFKISGMYIGNPSSEALVNANLTVAGLFGYTSGASTSNKAEIFNLNLECFIQNTTSAAHDIGGLVGYAQANTKITGCFTEGLISTANTNTGNVLPSTGGFIGECGANLEISNSGNFAKVITISSGNSNNCYVAGLVADIRGVTTISKSFNAGDIKGTSYYTRVGGLVGYVGSSTTITDCYSTGNIELNSGISSSYAGGLVGYAATSTNFTNCYCTGNVKVTGSAYYAGGLVGSGLGSINNCYATGDVSISYNSGSYVGGLAGSFSGTVTNSYFSISAKQTWNNGGTSRTTPTAYGSGNPAGTAGYTNDFMQKEPFVNLLNSNKGINSDWVLTNEYPGLKDVMFGGYIIKFYKNDGTPDYISVRQPEHGNFKLPRPIWEGHAFLGWFQNSDGTGTLITDDKEVGDAEIGNITEFYAKWGPVTVSYRFKIELWDDEENKIESGKAAALISDAAYLDERVFEEEDPLSGIYSLENPRSGYRFLYQYKIENKTTGETEILQSLDGYSAGYFETLGYSNYETDPEELIIIKLIYKVQYRLSFTGTENATLTNQALVSIKIGDEIIKRFFEDMYLDKGTLIEIVVIPAPGKMPVEILPLVDENNRFELTGDNMRIKVIMGDESAADIILDFKLDERLPETLTPYTESRRYTFMNTEKNIGKILTTPNEYYTLTGWAIFINDETNALNFDLELDANKNILALNILDISDAYNDDVFKITLQPLWKLNTGIIIMHEEGSSTNMGSVKYYKENIEISLSEIAEGDVITVKLIPNDFYEIAGSETQDIKISGIERVSVKFKPISYSLSNNNDQAELKTNKVEIGDSIVINIKAGFGSELDKNSLEVKIGEKTVKSEFIKIQGNSLIITANSEFLAEYALANEINLDIDFSTKMNGLLIGIISGSSVLAIGAAILILLYMMALKKRKIQLQKAEEKHKIGMAMLSASERIKNIRDEE